MFRLTSITLAVFTAGAAWAAPAGLTELGQGIADYNAHNYKAAVEHLETARQVTKLSDYDSYYLAYSKLLTGDVEGSLNTLTAYRAAPVDSSPLAGRITALYARVLLDKRDPQGATRALSVLQTSYKTLPQPDGDFAMGLAYESQGEQQQAALSYQRVYYSFPNTDLAAQASTALDRLRGDLGKDFPVVPPNQQLERPEKWLAAKAWNKARMEYQELGDRLSGPDQASARLGIAVSDYLAGSNSAALRELKAFDAGKSETEAERLYYVAEAARKDGDDALMISAVNELSEKYATSQWRLKALVTAANRYVLTNESARYEPLFRTAYEAFPGDGSTAYAHWKVTWNAYEADKPERASLMKEQVEQYPDDSRAGSALYFLGRMAEAGDKPAEARAYYDRLSAQFPHYFYAVLGRERLRDKVAAAAPDAQVKAWLDDVEWREHPKVAGADPNAETKARIERARLLNDAGLPDMSDAEMRFGATAPNAQPQLLALEMAQSADTPFRALRIMKSLSGDYLSLPLENAPIRFWQMLFPLPYKDSLFESAKARGLDPYYVAALIRQESEFNPEARSRVNALGLMQLMPATGRLVAREAGMRSVPTSLLLNPDVSMKLGTQYLKGQLDSWDGNWYRTLAAYNAGPGRVHQWLGWSDYRDPVEFVESIPFTETRDYVQAVLRNADMYREIYSGRHDSELAPVRRPVPSVVASAAGPSSAVRASHPASAASSARKTSPTPAKKTIVASRKRVAPTNGVASKKVTANTTAVASKKPVAKKHLPAGVTEAVIVGH